MDRQNVLDRLRLELYRLRDRFRYDSGALEALDVLEAWAEEEDVESRILHKPYKF